MFCAKAVTCISGVTEDQCKASINGLAGTALSYVKCVNDDTLSDIAACIEAADCADFTEATQTCYNQVLGITSDQPQPG